MELENLISRLKGEGSEFSSFSEVEKELTLDTFTQLLYDRPEKIDSEFKDNNGNPATFTSVETYYLVPASGDIIKVGMGSQFSTIAEAKVSYDNLKALVISKIEKTNGESEIDSHMNIVIYK